MFDFLFGDKVVKTTTTTTTQTIKESFENKALKWWMTLSNEEQIKIGLKYDEPTFNLTLRAIMFEFEQFKKK